MQIKITEQMLETLGDSSLVGMVMENRLKYAGDQSMDLELIFPQSTMAYRLKYGPKQHVVNEFTVPLVIKDIMWLIEAGFKIKLSMPTEAV